MGCAEWNQAHPPYTSSALQKDDARDGTNQAFKDTAWPAAQGRRKKCLLRRFMTRPLDRADFPAVMEEAHDGKDACGTKIGAFRQDNMYDLQRCWL